MIENYRTGMLWDLFMSNPEIQPMLDAIGFHSQPNPVETLQEGPGFSVYPNPSGADFRISFYLDQSSAVKLEILSVTGATSKSVVAGQVLEAGTHEYTISGKDLIQGIHLTRLIINNKEIQTIKMIKQ